MAFALGLTSLRLRHDLTFLTSRVVFEHAADAAGL